MAYSTSFLKSIKGPVSTNSGVMGPMSVAANSGQKSYQSSVPKPMYAPTPVPNSAPLVAAVTRPPAPVAAPQAPAANDFNSPANVAARAQLAQENANLAQYGNAQGTQPLYTPQQMSQQAEQQSLTARALANPGTIAYGAANSNGTTNQSYAQPTYKPTVYSSPVTEQSMGALAMRTADGGYTGLTKLQAQTLFGTNFTGIDQNPDGTFSITADTLRERVRSGTGSGDPAKFRPDLVNVGDGTYSVTRPNTWSRDEERIMNAAAQELNAIEQQNAQPGVNPAIVAQNQYRLEYLRNQVNEYGQRKQAYALAGNADTSNMSDQEYLTSLLTNPDYDSDTIANAAKAVGLNQDHYAKQAKQSAEASAQVAMQELEKNHRSDRDKLIAQLSLRGLSPDSDSYAAAQLRELDDKYRDLNAAKQAELQAATLAVDEKTRSYLQGLADKRIEEAHKKIADFAALQNAKANAYSKTTNADTNAAKVDVAEEKNRIDEMYKMGRLSTDQYKAEIAKLNQESLTDLRTSQADLADANADYTAGAKTADTVAATALKEANTNKINTLLPAQLAQINAQVAKLQRTATGTGGKAGAKATATPEELAAIVALNKGNMPTTAAATATLLNAVRTVNGDVTNLVKVGNDAAAARSTATRKPTTSTSSKIDALFQ